MSVNKGSSPLNIATAVAALVADLAAEATPPQVFNPYSPATPDSAGRRRNLACYLTQVLAQPPRWLLLGEAAGYRGCGRSGVPFTSEAWLQRDPLHAWGCRPEPRADAPLTEATATYVWEALATTRPWPVLWNAYPFHPHQPGRPNSNRRPAVAEWRAGAAFTRQVIALAPGVQLAAVGRIAASQLAYLGWPHAVVRHPSHGGRRAFVAGLQALGVIAG